MEFKDVANLYLGCKLQVFSPIKDTFIGELTPTHYATFVSHNGTIMGAKVKPILYPLSAMTDEQAIEIFGYSKRETDEWYCELWVQDIGKPLAWVELLKRHYDLFDLIKSNQAIDATILEVNPYQ